MTEKPKTTNQIISDTDNHNLSKRSVDKSAKAAERQAIIAESNTPKSEGNQPSEKKGNGKK